MHSIAVPLSMSTAYLLPCHSGYLQIDTGYAWDYLRYRSMLAHAGVALPDVHYLLLTHHHDDHAGFVGDLARDTELTILAHEQAKLLLLTGTNDTSHGGGYVNRRVKLLASLKMWLDPRWTLTFPPFELRPHDILMRGDDPALLRSLGIAGSILATPGHCIDHLAVVLDNGDAFCGDAAANMLRWAGTRYCTVFMTDMEQAYQSWQKLLAAGATTIYPAHGKPFPAAKLRDNMGRFTTAGLARFF
jgi:glyoxylase-like metal-dependent hydrolase (beta-lactamase superfamily II)